MNHAKIISNLLAWFSQDARDLPWRRTSEPYAVWVSEIMLQQTQVKTVVPYWERWMQALTNIRALARAKPERLHKLWEGLGYYSRVRNMRRAARLILAKHGGRFPENFDDVLELPGIGRYTAGAICSIAFNQPRPILDGNVIRVLCRVFGIEGNPRENKTNALLWQLAEELVQHAAKASRITFHVPRLTQHSTLNTQHFSRPCSQFNQSLMELGALVCTPKAPKCPVCPVGKHCLAFRQGRVSELPRPSQRAPTIKRRHVAFVAWNRGRVLVRRRPSGAVNAHLWEFPNVEVRQNRCSLAKEARSLLGIRASSFVPICTVKHSITRYRITLEVFRVEAHSKRESVRKGKWLTPRELSSLPFTGAHKKILEHLRT